MHNERAFCLSPAWGDTNVQKILEAEILQTENLSVALQYNLHQDLILGKEEIQKLFAWGIEQWFWQKHHNTWSLSKQIQKLGLWFFLPPHAPECL